MSKYYVLWLEDTPEEVAEFKSNLQAERPDIELVHFKSADKACEYIEANIEDLSAAILDIEANQKYDDNKELASSSRTVMKLIDQLQNRNPIKYFAFTGKSRYIEDDQATGIFQCKILDKNFQLDEAIDLIQEYVDTHSDTVIKKSYSSAFEIFDCVVNSEPVLDYSLQHQLINLVKAWDNYSLRNSGLMYGLIRPITEKVIKIMMQKGIINVNEKESSWNERSRILGKLSNKFEKEIPSFIARAVHTVFDVCPEGIHDCALFDAINQGKAPFLLQSLTLELFNILAWFPQFIVLHNDRESNLEHFRLDEPEAKLSYENKEGIVKQDGKGNYYINQCLLNPRYAHNYLGKCVIIREIKDNTTPSKDKYPYFAKKIFPKM